MIFPALKWVKSLSHVWLFATQWTAARQTSLSFTTSQSLLKLMSVELAMSSNHIISSVIPFSCLLFDCKTDNQSDFSINHLVMSMCRVLSCVVWKGCLLWSVCYLGKTLVAFALLHFVSKFKHACQFLTSSNALLWLSAQLVDHPIGNFLVKSTQLGSWTTCGCSYN